MPSVNVLLYHGSKAERKELREGGMGGDSTASSFPIIVTSYEIMNVDAPFMQKYAWKYLVVDEVRQAAHVYTGFGTWEEMMCCW